ncbi:MAG: helix-hairpin-helix domain-containing protein [Spirochaetes bacterium]|nr:helix-hairpin-helix domain-containing protein [Spirochaetota bacterium]
MINESKGGRQDRCLLYVIRCAVYFVSEGSFSNGGTGKIKIRIRGKNAKENPADCRYLDWP